MKSVLTLVFFCLLSSCATSGGSRAARDWQPEPRPVLGQLPSVPEYEVEFLPMLPADPRAIVVGKFHIRKGARLRLEDEELTLAIKRKAAAMGGNTIVYPYFGIEEATVAYVPLEPVNLHGGDEELEQEDEDTAGGVFESGTFGDPPAETPGGTP